jgi:thiol-disulfide isomerase/thioredoxin
MPLQIGERIPDVHLTNLINAPGQTIKINDFRGKLVILELWNVWCTSCVRLMPKLDSLQREFGDKIKIILVTENSQREVVRLFEKLKRNMPSLLMITNDTLLNNLFPHVTVPHQVWIDGSGMVKFITDGYNATRENIVKVLNNGPLYLHFKNEIDGFDINQHLLLEGNGRLKSHLTYYSIFMSWLDEYGGSLLKVGEIDSMNKTATTRLINLSILDFFKLAYGELIPDGQSDIYLKGLFDNRIIFDIQYRNDFYEPTDDSKKDEWKSKNLFSYESVMPLARIKELRCLMRADLKRYFPFEAEIVKRKVKCIVLKRTSDLDKIQTHAGKSEFMSDKNGISLKNVAISCLVQTLANVYQELRTPVIDGSHYYKNIDLVLKANLKDLAAVKKELRRFDLDLIEEVIEIDMLTIR